MVVADRYETALESIVPKIKPMNYARVTIIDGDQGSGKSMSAISFGVDTTFERLTSVKLENGITVKARPFLNKQGYPVIGYGRLWLPNQEPKVMKIPPKSCVIAEGVRVIYNGHMYGIRYLHMELVDIIKHLGKDDDILKDCILVIDEAYIGADRREGLSPLVKVLSKLSKQLRKRHIHLIMCTPDSSELDLRFQKIEVEHIACSYDETTDRVTKFIRNRKKYKRIREVEYTGQPYRKYYNTDEIFEIPEIQLVRALAMAGMKEEE
jgi:hypothetical protein